MFLGVGCASVRNPACFSRSDPIKNCYGVFFFISFRDTPDFPSNDEDLIELPSRDSAYGELVRQLFLTSRMIARVAGQPTAGSNSFSHFADFATVYTERAYKRRHRT